MSAAWSVVLATGAGSVALKALAPVALGGRDLPARVRGVLALLAPALLAALVATQAFAGDRALVVDARAAGLGAALVAVALRAPVLVVVAVAAATAGSLRAVT